MMQELPDFQRRPFDQVMAFAREVFTLEGGGRQTFLQRLIEYPDGHYRAVFRPAYFVLPEGRTEPSKSQWNSLKKKLKRHNPRVFLFKQHGAAPCDDGAPCCYLDFGFFAQ